MVRNIRSQTGLQSALRFATHAHTPLHERRRAGPRDTAPCVLDDGMRLIQGWDDCANPLSPLVPTRSSPTSSSWRTRLVFFGLGLGAGVKGGHLSSALPLLLDTGHSTSTSQEGLLRSLSGGHWRLLCDKGRRGGLGWKISPRKHACGAQV